MTNQPIDSAEAKKLSKGVREKWLNSIVSGEVSLDTALAYSLTDDREASYVANIRLSTILEAMPDWSGAAVTSVLLFNGFKANDTIKTIRSASIKAAKFKNILESPAPSSSSTRPKMPEGWPWNGKLSDLVRLTRKGIPSTESEEDFGVAKTTVPSTKPVVPQVPVVEKDEKKSEPANDLEAPKNPYVDYGAKGNTEELVWGSSEPDVSDDDIEALMR